MKLIVCSVPDTLPDEHELVQDLMQCGLSTFHLRKPAFSKADMRNWLESLTDAERQKVVIHSHWELSKEFLLKGVHFGAAVVRHMSPSEALQWIDAARERGLTVSSSVHDQDEIDRLPAGFDYVWLSPVFESISKQAYRSAFTDGELDAWVKELREKKQTETYALGGITAQQIKELRRRGFHGAVVLGSVWQAVKGKQDKESIKQRFEQLNNSCKTDITS